MPIDRKLDHFLYEVRAMLWTNAHRRVFGARHSNLGVSLPQLAPEAESLRMRVEARVKYPPQREAQEIARLMPLPDLFRYPYVIPALAQAVSEGKITPADIERFMLTSEFTRPQVEGKTPEPEPAAA